MFDITNRKGFHMTFANGWTISVQWGEGNYCDNYSANINRNEDAPASKTAEVAAWNGEEWHEFDNSTGVVGYCSADKILEYMNIIAAKT
jgi:hypothetical protein